MKNEGIYSHNILKILGVGKISKTKTFSEFTTEEDF